MTPPDTRTAVPVVAPEAVLEAPDAVAIDLRSPKEFAEDHVPGAVNVPLFNDVERAVIGALYHRSSPERAFEEARAITRAKIGALVRDLAAAAGWELPLADLEERVERITSGGLACMEEELAPMALAEPPERPVLLYCWRGGLRSRSVTALVRELGLERAVALEGGYKGWRRHVMESLAAFEPPPVFVLRGLTGVGKTLVLRELERIRPGWTVDLEALAGHRGSILGMVGLEPCSQKAFETRLCARLAAGFPGPCVLEGESRKIGDAVLPARVWEALDGGVNVLLETPLEGRVDVLIADYLACQENRAMLREQLPFIEERLGRSKWSGELVRLLDGGRERELVRVLLERYYDPLYRHSETGRTYATKADASDPARAARAVAAWIERS
ncbi:MAG: tRNA 2-selenouridine(34) synthase MnmH [Planctomycetota bacterium]|nr:tRNA 2-selenouridine(34) synthase MnmH [Planctomycetota bacterium]